MTDLCQAVHDVVQVMCACSLAMAQLSRLASNADVMTGRTQRRLLLVLCTSCKATVRLPTEHRKVVYRLGPCFAITRNCLCMQYISLVILVLHHCHKLWCMCHIYSAGAAHAHDLYLSR